MNKLIKSIVMGAAASSLLMTSLVQADTKVAVVNFQEVMGKIPQTADFMATLEAEIKDDKAIITQLEKDIKYYQEKIKRDAMTLNAKQKTELETKISDLFRDYQTKGKALNDRIAARQNAETNKLVGVIRQVVDKIAAKKEYDLVVEQKSVIFLKPELNITQDVIEQVSKLK